MTDIITYCEINTCEDCPRYGDDCDGDKRVEHTDLIKREDAIDCCECHGSQECKDRIKALPSADAVSRKDTVTLNSPISIQTEMVAVVRCKDCRHRNLFSCPLADNDFQKDDDYCSWGERSEE